MKANHHSMQRWLSEISYWGWVFIIGSALGLFLYRMVPQSFELEVVAQTELEKAEIKCFWDTGSGFSERKSRGLPLRSGPAFEIYRFALPHRGTLQTIRLDPISKSGSIQVQSIRLHHSHRLFGRAVDISQLTTNDHIASIEKTQHGYVLTTHENAGDPILLLSGPFVAHVPPQGSKFTRLGLFLTVFAGLLLKAILKWKSSSNKTTNFRFDVWIQKHPRYSTLLYSGLLAVLLLFFIWQSLELAARRTYVEVDLRFEQPSGNVQLFWAEDTRFNGRRSRSYSIDTKYHRHQIRFEVPNNTRFVRLDLPGRQQTFRIRSVEVSQRPFGSTHPISALQPIRINQLTTANCDQESACYRITGQDPWLVFQLP